MMRLFLLFLLCAGLPAAAADLVPHRALYGMSLARAGSGIVSAEGQMLVVWADACDSWTFEQRFRLRLSTGEGDEDSDMAISFLSTEAKDGTGYRFIVTKDRSGEPREEVEGRAELGPQGGRARFTKPEVAERALPRGASFPVGHTLLLIAEAERGTRFISRRVFEGSEVEGAIEVSAVIGQKQPPAAGAKGLLARPGWPVRLAYFTEDSSQSEPDYEMSMVLLDNGVVAQALIDYRDFAVRARLIEVQALPRQGC
ncbi:MAG: cell envelope integrity EipB family protein [Thalassobaculales bacterium]